MNEIAELSLSNDYKASVIRIFCDSGRSKIVFTGQDEICTYDVLSVKLWEVLRPRSRQTRMVDWN